MKKFLAVIFALLIFAGVSYAAQDTLTYNLGADPRTIDPAINNALDGSKVIGNIFEGLFRYGFNNVPEPACAESYSVSEDGLTWTFKLRDNLKWSDGKDLTAQDFVYGFTRLLMSANASPYANYGFFIKNAEAFYNDKVQADELGLKALDDKTLEIKLEYQNPLMLEYLSFHIFMPARRDIVEANPAAWAAKPETLISNGAFKLESWKHGEGGEMILTKNPYYFEADKVKLQHVRFVMINDQNTALAAFKAGRIDYLDTLPSQMLPMLMKSGQVKSSPALSITYFIFNVTRPPFDNPKVRRAFALAVDRKVIAEKIALGGEKPATGLIPYGVPGTTPEKDFRTEGGAFLPEGADVEEARKLLAEAGYPEGKNFPEVMYRYNSNPSNKAIAEALQAMFKKNLGVNVTLFNEEWKVFLENRRKKEFDIARDGWAFDFYDASNMLENFITSSANNNTGYKNPEVDDFIAKAAKEMDYVTRVNYLHEAEKLIMNDLPGVPLFFQTAHNMQKPNLKNVYKNALGFLFFRVAEFE